MKNASKNNIQNLILDSIENAAAEVCENSGVNIRKMPEYYINVVIAHDLCEAFPSLGFRLELPVKDLLDKFGIVSSKSPLELRDGGKFDIVLHSRKSKKIRHVIEVKRSLNKLQIRKDALRIAALAHENHGSRRLETGYIVAIRRLKNSCKSRSLEELIDDRIDMIKSVTNNMDVSARYALFEPGEVGFSSEERLGIIVFCLQKNNAL